MSRLVDAQGRLFGRLNLVDALALAFVCALIPAAYASWLLLRPAAPRIDRVEPSAVTSAELKIAAGEPILMKVKVHGEGFTPMLRAFVGGIPAMGFTFESPRSADVIIGENVPAGSHDLILYDGGLEVARAPGAIVVVPTVGTTVRLVGALTLLDAETAERLRAGQQFVVAGTPLAEILALGPLVDDRRLIRVASGAIDTPSPGTQGREAIVRVRCDADTDPNRCVIGGIPVGGEQPVEVVVPGSVPQLRMRVNAVTPDQAPQQATVRVRVDGAAGGPPAVRVGDRDGRMPSIDDRAAVVKGVHRAGTSLDITLRLGLDGVRGGWMYYAQRIAPGEPFALYTDRYAAEGRLMEVVVDDER